MSRLSFFPDANGSVQDWAVGQPIPAYAAVMDFNGQNEDIDYIVASALGKASYFKTQARPVLPPVVLISWVSIRARIAPQSGFPRANCRIVSGGQTFNLPIMAAATGQYTTFDGPTIGGAWLCFMNPYTNKPWQYQEALDAEFGIAFSSGAGNEIRCTQLKKLMEVAFDPNGAAVRYSKAYG